MAVTPDERPTRRAMLTRSAGVAAAVAAAGSVGAVVGSADPAEAQTQTTLAAPMYFTAPSVSGAWPTPPAGTAAMVIGPSGDPSGNEDATYINDALAAGLAVQLLPGTFYVNKTIAIPSGGILCGPYVGPPGKHNSSAHQSPVTIQVVSGVTDLDAVIADTSYLSGTSTMPSGSIIISGLVIDGGSTYSPSNDQAPPTGTAHGICLMCGASVIQNVGVQNTVGAGITLTDQAATIGKTAGAYAETAMLENKILWCTTYNTGTFGIWVQKNHTIVPDPSAITDGYLYDCIVDQNFQGSADYAAIRMDASGGWRVKFNHVYATLGDAYDIPNMSGTYFVGNRTDNFGQSSSGDYYGYNIGFGGPGCWIEGNQTNQTKGGSITSTGINWTHFAVSGPATPDPVYMSANLVGQNRQNSGTNVGFAFTAGANGLPVRGMTSQPTVPANCTTPLTTSGTGTGTVSFLGP
jgi:hypothetical protein